MLQVGFRSSGPTSYFPPAGHWGQFVSFGPNRSSSVGTPAVRFRLFAHASFARTIYSNSATQAFRESTVFGGITLGTTIAIATPITAIVNFLFTESFTHQLRQRQCLPETSCFHAAMPGEPERMLAIPIGPLDGLSLRFTDARIR